MRSATTLQHSSAFIYSVATNQDSSYLENKNEGYPKYGLVDDIFFNNNQSSVSLYKALSMGLQMT